MVKFSKELEAQVILEWKEAFVNYRQLKKHVKRIKLSCKPKLSFPNSNRSAIGDLFCRICGGRRSPVTIKAKARSEIHMKEEDDDDEEENEEGEDNEVELCQQTELSQLFSLEDEVRSFLEMLKDELTKVNQFHAARETEFLERGDLLKKQLQILLDVKKVLSDRRRPGVFPRSSSSSLQNSDRFSSSVISSNSFRAEGNDSGPEDVIAALKRNGINFVNSAKIKKGDAKTSFRIDIPATGRIAAARAMIWEDFMNNPKKGAEGVINRRQVQCAEKMIRNGFVELYRGLGLLKTYSGLNMLAFSKILKKFGKVSSLYDIANDHLLSIKESYFITSDKVVKLMDELESLFTQHFADNDRRKTVKFLKPQQNRGSSHMVTFFVGLFTGSFFMLFSAYVILSHSSGVFSSRAETSYMDIVYHVFSMFALFSLHLFMYGCNLLMWKRTRINHNFIFDFKANTALKYRDAFLLCTCIMTAVVGAMVLHLFLIYNSHLPRNQTDLIPAILLLVSAVIIVCPFNVLYRSTRYCFLRVIGRIICAPFYKVVMVDFFMADQLTSLIPMFRHMESAACYFLAKNFTNPKPGVCKSERMFMELAYVVSFLPYFWRAMQCARRWHDESHIDHIANLGKYVSAMVAAGARLSYSRQPTVHWKATVVGTSVIATVYQLYWDFVKDWGFLHPNSRNPWLRDELVLKNRGIYYASIALNFILRVAWIQTIVRFDGGIFESQLIDFLFASLEVIRRGHWNYYRLENEHLNNVGKFRVLRPVPLPFQEDDSDV